MIQATGVKNQFFQIFPESVLKNKQQLKRTGSEIGAFARKKVLDRTATGQFLTSPGGAGGLVRVNYAVKKVSAPVTRTGGRWGHLSAGRRGPRYERLMRAAIQRIEAMKRGIGVAFTGYTSKPRSGRKDRNRWVTSKSWRQIRSAAGVPKPHTPNLSFTGTMIEDYRIEAKFEPNKAFVKDTRDLVKSLDGFTRLGAQGQRADKIQTGGRDVTGRQISIMGFKARPGSARNKDNSASTIGLGRIEMRHGFATKGSADIYEFHHKGGKGLQRRAMAGFTNEEYKRIRDYAEKVVGAALSDSRFADKGSGYLARGADGRFIAVRY